MCDNHNHKRGISLKDEKKHSEDHKIGVVEVSLET